MNNSGKLVNYIYKILNYLMMLKPFFSNSPLIIFHLPDRFYLTETTHIIKTNLTFKLCPGH